MTDQMIRSPAFTELRRRLFSITTKEAMQEFKNLPLLNRLNFSEREEMEQLYHLRLEAINAGLKPEW